MNIKNRIKSIVAIPMVALIAAFAVFMLYGTPASAEGNCPEGYFPVGGGNGGWTGCAPLPTQEGGGQPRAPGPQWATQWGAIASDRTTGGLGGSEGHSSKRAAKKAAVAACLKDGGTNKCKPLIAYYNQCGALAWGDYTVITYRGPNLDVATTEAMKLCSEKSKICQIFYSGCSYPVRVR
jgi:Domain of unknown function (DUF4189)